MQSKSAVAALVTSLQNYSKEGKHLRPFASCTVTLTCCSSLITRH